MRLPTYRNTEDDDVQATEYQVWARALHGLGRHASIAPPSYKGHR
ncbi:hypothetical protein ABT115_20305 [Streptomyces sp. NPDC001832]